MTEYYSTGKKSHKKGAGASTRRGRPRTGRKNRHFSPMAAGRVVAYARRDNPHDDAKLARYLLYAFGVNRGPCVLAQIFVLAGNMILLGVMFRLVRGVTYILSGLRAYLAEDVAVEYSGDLFVDVLKYLETEYSITLPATTKAEWLIWMGSLQAGLSAFLLFLDGLNNQVIYFRFLDKVCEMKIEARPFKIIPRPLFGD
jgi:hypothetical protein